MPPLDRDVETLRNIPLFASLPTPKLKLIALTAEIVRFEPGEAIVQQGDPADAVYIIAEGETEVWLERSPEALPESGDPARDRGAVAAGGPGSGASAGRRIASMGPNTLFGEIAVLCRRGKRTTTVRATTPVVTFKIRDNVFLDLVRQSPEIGMQVMTVLAERLERTTNLLQQKDR
jgi:CRP-like cAMP-binding protein